jgi:hypothetical protein
MTKLGLKKQGLLGLLFVLSSGCSNQASDDAPGAPPPSTYGNIVKVSVAGRGVVSSEPGGIYCGNDADQSRCDGAFVYEPDGKTRKVVLIAKEHPDWHFQGWEFTVDDKIPYDPGSPSVDLENPKLVFSPGSVRGPDGKDRPLRYRLTAKFAPTSELSK